MDDMKKFELNENLDGLVMDSNKKYIKGGKLLKIIEYITSATRGLGKSLYIYMYF